MSSSARKVFKAALAPKIMWSEGVFGYCIDVEISRKNFYEGTALVYGDYQFMGRFFRLMQQETMCFLPCQIYLL